MFAIGITPGRRGIPETSISSTYESSFSSAPTMSLADRWSLIGTRIEDIMQRPTVKKEVVEKVVHRPSPDPKVFPLIGSYDRVTSSVLEKLPSNIRMARRKLQIILTPPTANTTKFFPWTPEQIKELYQVYQKQIRFRFQMKRLVLHYLQRKSKVMNETDPITMEPPTQVISLYAPNMKSIYQFEARSLAHHWTTLLLGHDDFFVEPRFPTNPLTNLPVDILSLKNAITSLRQYGHLNWVLESFASCKFNPSKWELQFDQPLRIEAIRSTLRDKDSRDRLDYLVEFADKQFYENMVSFNKHLFTWLFKEHPMSHYERSWETLCAQYYINKITTTNSEMLERLQEAIVVKSKRLMDIPPEIKEAWDKVRPRIRLTRSRALSVLDVSSPSIIYTAAVRRGRDALIEDFLLESVLASALESTATSLLTAAAEVETDTEEEIELERSSP
jgi:hypothetical protein